MFVIFPEPRVSYGDETKEILSPLLRSVRRRTKPTTVDLYEVFCALLYVLRTGCQWRCLPSEFPKWQTVYAYFAKWKKPDQDGISVQGRALKNQVGAAREKLGRSCMPTLVIVDAQSVNNTDTAGSKDYDAGKKVSGIKRHIVVDTQGLPHAVSVTTADINDRTGALEAMQRCQASLSAVQALLCDGGYAGRPFERAVKQLLGRAVEVQIAKRSQWHPFAVIAQRWVIERSFAWLEKNQKLYKNCERCINTSLQFVHVAFLALVLRRS